jgi:hypothetical protein
MCCFSLLESEEKPYMLVTRVTFLSHLDQIFQLQSLQWMSSCIVYSITLTFVFAEDQDGNGKRFSFISPESHSQLLNELYLSKRNRSRSLRVRPSLFSQFSVHSNCFFCSIPFAVVIMPRLLRQLRLRVFSVVVTN